MTDPAALDTHALDPQSLDEVRADAFRRLSRGVADRRSPFRTPTLATLGGDGCPRLRTVVLRGFDPAARRITVHSDLRAAKIGEIGADPRVALHIWDDGAQVQIRLDGTAAVQSGAAAQGEWDWLHSGSRASYRIRPMPGTVLADPATADADQVEEEFASKHFAVIVVFVTGLEWLHLARDGHRRAAFAWTDAGMQADWLVP